MSPSLNPASLAELSRWLRVEEGSERDRLELASPWQRLAPDAPNRQIARIGSSLIGLLLLMLFVQAALTTSTLAWGLFGFAFLAMLLLAWWLRSWFWRAIVDVDAQQISISHRGWSVPATVSLSLETIDSLRYRMHGGQLAGLTLIHQHGQLALPFSGQRELDKLYCNLLRHLLQKRRPAIGFGQADILPGSPS
ncbi:hypothetical protein [Chitinimonas sp.]|uniref:hypothetical protein n=1 Tax=Chitinimonas sp. TaxID=1934313 RepID=UPI0035B2C95B